MQNVSRMARQGDVLLIRRDAVPEGTVEQERAPRIIVAHSETGHHHAIEGSEARLFELIERNPLVCYLQVDGAYADLVHHRSYHTHETLRLTQGCWEVRRQREFGPEGWTRVLD